MTAQEIENIFRQDIGWEQTFSFNLKNLATGASVVGHDKQVSVLTIKMRIMGAAAGGLDSSFHGLGLSSKSLSSHFLSGAPVPRRRIG